MHSALVKANVEFLKQGNKFYVPFSELQYKMPTLWKSIIEVDRVRWKILNNDRRP